MAYVEFDYLGREYNSREANREAIVTGGAAALFILAGLGIFHVVPMLLAVGGIVAARELGLEIKHFFTQWKGRREKKAGGH